MIYRLSSCRNKIKRERERERGRKREREDSEREKTFGGLQACLDTKRKEAHRIVFNIHHPHAFTRSLPTVSGGRLESCTSKKEVEGEQEEESGREIERRSTRRNGGEKVWGEKKNKKRRQRVSAETGE